MKVFGGYAGPEDELRALLEPLGEPRSARVQTGSYREAKRFLAGLGGAGEEEDTGHAYLRSEYFAEPLPPDAIAALVGALRRRRLRIASSTSRPGAARTAARRSRRRRSPTATRAFCSSTRPWSSRAGRSGRRARGSTRAHAITHPYGTGGVYPNFPEDDLDPWAVEYLGANRERLLELKRRYDPDGVLL